MTDNIKPFIAYRAIREKDNTHLTPADLLQWADYELKNNEEYKDVTKAVVIFLDEENSMYGAHYLAAKLKSTELIALLEVVKLRVYKGMFGDIE